VGGQINRMRAQVMEAVRNPLPGGAPTSGSAGPSGLFGEFDYIPEQYNREDMLAEQERLDSHAKREKVRGPSAPQCIRRSRSCPAHGRNPVLPVRAALLSARKGGPLARETAFRTDENNSLLSPMCFFSSLVFDTIRRYCALIAWQ